METSEKIEKLLEKKWFWMATIALMSILWAMIEIGGRLPYLYTEFAFNVRAYVILPLVALFLGWPTFIGKSPFTGTTGYRYFMAGIKSRRERIKATLCGVAGYILFTFAIPWMSINIPICLAYLTAKTPYAESYRVEEIDSTGHNRFDIYLTHVESGEEVIANQSWDETSKVNRDYRLEDTVCVRGRTSVFGTIIESIRKSEEGCD